MEFGFAIFCMLIIGLSIRLIAGVFDEDRVKEYIENRGGELISKEWDPMGKGWFGEQNDRIYFIKYIDKDGNKHEASVKTSTFSGVYFTEDEIVEYASARPKEHENIKSEISLNVDMDVEKLKAENEKLKKEIEALKKNGESEDELSV